MDPILELSFNIGPLLMQSTLVDNDGAEDEELLAGTPTQQTTHLLSDPDEPPEKPAQPVTPPTLPETDDLPEKLKRPITPQRPLKLRGNTSATLLTWAARFRGATRGEKRGVSVLLLVVNRLPRALHLSTSCLPLQSNQMFCFRTYLWLRVRTPP